jgi:hypothetical protein
MRLLTIAGLLALLAPATALSQVALSPDTTVDLAGMTFADEDALIDLVATTIPLALGTLPEPSDVDAYHYFSNGDRLYSLDISADLGAGVSVTAADVVRFDGSTNTIEFNASAEGLPDGVIVDATTVHSSGDLMLSLDTTVDLGGGVVAGDEDLVRFDGLTTYTVFFDGSAQSIANGLDLDGAHYQPSDGHLFLSFDGSGAVGGVDFDDEDILEFEPSGPTWSLFYDGSAQHASLAAADVTAVPEPDGWLLVAAGSAALMLLSWKRART